MKTIPEDVIEALAPAAGTTLLIAVGNPLRGDDAAAIYVAEHLSVDDPRFQSIITYDRPENCIDQALAIKPFKTIILDAANFNAPAGEIRKISVEDIPESAISTHSFPLKIIAKLLEKEAVSEVSFIGIQMEHYAFDSPMSEPVIESVEALLRHINRVYSSQ